MKKFSVLLCALLSFSLTFGQELENTLVDLSTPQRSVITHLSLLQPESYSLERSAQVFLREGMTLEEAQKVALEWKQILDGKGLYIDVTEIPDVANYSDSITHSSRYILVSEYPDIYLERIDGRWVYSERSIAAILKLYDQVVPPLSEIFMKVVPRYANNQFLGLKIWQYVGMAFILLISLFAFYIFTFILKRIIFQILRKLKYDDEARRFVIPIARPFSYFIIFYAIKYFLPALQFPIEVSQYLVLGLDVAIPVFWIIIFYRIVDLILDHVEAKLRRKESSTLNRQLTPLLSRLMKVIVVVIGLLYVLNNIGTDIRAFLAGLSIGGLAFALAAQDTLKNFFGSLMIFLDRPFQIGDWITSGPIDGTVEEVGFRATRIRTFRNSVTYVPNARLVDSMVDNHGMRVYRRLYINIGITYDTPVDLIETYVKGLRKIVENHPETRKDYYEVHLNDMGDFSLKIMFYIFFQVPTWSDELRCRHEILLEVIRLAENIGVRFAFPTQTLHMETFPDKSSLTPLYADSAEEFDAKMHAYFANKDGKRLNG